MIRVPRKNPERFIPIQYDTQLDVLEKALKQTVGETVETKMSATEIREDLAKQVILRRPVEYFRFE